MSTPTNWPLPTDGIRYVLPAFLVAELQSHPLARELYPLSFGFYPHAAGHEATRLVHDDHLLIYCRDGCGRVHLDDRTIDVRAGDLLTFPKGHAHAYQADPAEPWTIYWVHFDGERADAYLCNADGAPIARRLHIGVIPRTIADFEALFSVRQSGYDLAAFLHAANTLKQLIASLVLTHGQLHTEPLVAAADTLMRERLHDSLDLDTLASAAGMSKYHFAKRYKRATGTAPIQRFLRLKIERACYLLDVTSADIGEVAAQLGISDRYYFSRLFRSLVGVSPRGYRRLRRG